MAKLTVMDVEVKGKRVLVRADLNVPLHPQTNEIADDGRIRAVLPTINYLLEHQSRIVLCSHLGRPKASEREFSLAPVAERLSQLLGKPVKMAADCVGPEVESAVAALQQGQVLMLENLRFHRAEEANDSGFAQALARLADIFVEDGFGVVHRTHASTVGVTRYLPSVAGLLVQKELEEMGKALHNPAHPFSAIVGGAKVSDKIAVLENLMDKVNSLMLAGGLGATFLKSLNKEMGSSPVVVEAKVGLARQLMDRAAQKGVHLLLPADLVVANKFDANAKSRVVSIDKVPRDWQVMDIGPKTIEQFEAKLQKSKTVIWVGPVGVFEFEKFRHGTASIAMALANLSATTIIGGGSTAEAVNMLGLAGRMTHVSTGGGASLKFLEGTSLPGIDALKDRA